MPVELSLQDRGPGKDNKIIECNAVGRIKQQEGSNGSTEWGSTGKGRAVESTVQDKMEEKDRIIDS